MSDVITMKEFKKLDIRIGTVAEVEKVPGSDKLYKLQVDIGGELRQIVTGLVDWYTADDLAGKVIAVVLNMKPAKIFGQWSYGMLLAAEIDGKLALLTTDHEIPNGARIT
ncbi:methionine--tRNA ligase subunit beta [Candidatus Bathyarchaeota archaeon]|jgi:methionine--tRNA ligase beta chain|nr:methionine--tRNA ligase subunit beta [Candidatus Bathyarchaeota archaeon]MBL7168078.1 methionine--tRNA ligase subunit beta [Candidatus Bathyarchaeota archaeon]